MIIKFKNGISGTLVDWTPDTTIYNIGSIKRRIESSNKGEAGIIAFDNVSLTLNYASGNNSVYNAFNGDLSAAQRYIFELHGKKSTGVTSKLFEGLTDFSSLNWPDLEKKINFDVVDKLKAFDIITNTTKQRGEPITITSRTSVWAPDADFIYGFSGAGSGNLYPGNDWTAFGHYGDLYCFVCLKRDSSYWGQPISNEVLMLNRGETIMQGDKRFLVLDSKVQTCPAEVASAIGYYVSCTIAKLYPIDNTQKLIVLSLTDPVLYQSTYFNKEAGYIEIASPIPDADGMYPITGFDALKIIEAIVENAWINIIISNQTTYNEFPISLEYCSQLLDEDPFDKHPLDAVKFLADSLLCYIYFNKEGTLILKKKTDISTGTVRTFTPSRIKSGGKKQYFWDKLVDAVTVVVNSGKTAIITTSGTLIVGERYYIQTYNYGDDFRNVGAASNTAGQSFTATGTTPATWANGSALYRLINQSNTDGVILQGNATVASYPGILPRNEIKMEIVVPNNIDSTQDALDAYALSIAQDTMSFYGKRHYYYDLTSILTDDMYDWDLLDLITINGEQYFILSLDIDEPNTSIHFELVSVQGYSYDPQQARIPLSPANYNNTAGGNFSTSSSSSPSSGSSSNYTFTSPLNTTGSVISLDYSDNLKLSNENKLDTIQDIKITSTPQFARLGIGGAADATIPLKIYGDISITGSLTLGSDFNLASGKVYKIDGTQVLSATTLGSNIINSSLTSIGTLNQDLNIVSGKVYKIDGTQVLSATTLGSNVINSSLTSVGIIGTGTWRGTTIKAGYIAFNSTNLKNDGSATYALNTIQDIATTSSPQFTNLTLTGTLDQQGTGTSYFGSQYILPKTNYYDNLGTLSKKYLTLYAAELWVETLVAQETIATIGGRILVGPTTSLVVDLAAGDSTIHVKHNQMVYGDIVYMEASGKIEFFQINSSYSGSAGNYTYAVVRNLDGSGANDWYAGDAMFNTGQANNGFIDIYSVRGVKSASQLGPTIVGNVRNSGTYNDWSEYWAIGNLNNLYGYSANTYGIGLGKNANSSSFITIDPTNGIRLRYKNSGGTVTDKITLDMSGNVTISGYLQVGNAASDVNNGSTTITGSKITTGTITLNQLNFTPVQNTNVVASINASAEGIVISGAKIQINGSTTFASGYDPTSKTSSSDVTTIIGNTVTTSYLNAKNITALGAVTAGTFSLNNGTFSVDANGKLTSTSAAIAGWDISSTSITKTNTTGNKSIVISLNSSVSNNSTGLIMTSTDSSVTKLVLNAGSYNDNGYARYGFCIWDNINQKFLMNIGYGGSGSNMVASISGLTIQGDITSSRFSTTNTLDHSGSYTGIILDGNQLYTRNSYGGVYNSGWLDAGGISWQVEPIPSSKTIEITCVNSGRYIAIDGYNVPKCFGVTDTPPTTNRQVGDTYIGTNYSTYIWNGSTWIQLN